MKEQTVFLNSERSSPAYNRIVAIADSIQAPDIRYAGQQTEHTVSASSAAESESMTNARI